jgi:Ankyrin repeats (3 copies)
MNPKPTALLHSILQPLLGLAITPKAYPATQEISMQSMLMQERPCTGLVVMGIRRWFHFYSLMVQPQMLKTATALNHCIMRRKRTGSQIVKMLIEVGVDPITPKTREDHPEYLRGGEASNKRETAVRYICKQGHTETILVMLLFLRSEAKEEILCESCLYGKAEAVLAVLQHSDVSVNAKFRGATALYLACQARSVSCVEALLARGADVHLISEWHPKPMRQGSSAGKQIPRTPTTWPCSRVEERQYGSLTSHLENASKRWSGPRIKGRRQQDTIVESFWRPPYLFSICSSEFT